jgi:uncharacterized membrane protein
MAGEKTEEKPAAAGSSSDRNLFGALCYIIGVLVPLFVLFTDKKKDKFLAFHAWQSLILTVVMFVVYMGVGILAVILTIVTGIGGMCLLPLYFVPLLAVLFLAYKAYLGVMYKLPAIGDFAEKQAGK